MPTLLAFLAFVGGSWALTSRARRQSLVAEDADGLRLTAAVQASLVVAIMSRISCRCRRRYRCGCSAGWRPSSRSGHPRASEGRARHVDPHGGPLEHALLLARDLVSLGVTCARWRWTRAAARFDAAGARVAVLPLERPSTPSARCACTASRGADVSTPTTAAAGCGRGVAPGGAAPCGPHAARSSGTVSSPEADPSLKARVAYRGLDRGLRRFTDVLDLPSHAMARLLAERIGYA